MVIAVVGVGVVLGVLVGVGVGDGVDKVAVVEKGVGVAIPCSCAFRACATALPAP